LGPTRRLARKTPETTTTIPKIRNKKIRASLTTNYATEFLGILLAGLHDDMHVHAPSLLLLLLLLLLLPPPLPP
jgi:hypothetical protein